MKAMFTRVIRISAMIVVVTTSAAAGFRVGRDIERVAAEKAMNTVERRIVAHGCGVLAKEDGSFVWMATKDSIQLFSEALNDTAAITQQEQQAQGEKDVKPEKRIKRTNKDNRKQPNGSVPIWHAPVPVPQSQDAGSTR